MTDSKPLCEWTRQDVKSGRQAYYEATAQANYSCRHCGRVAAAPPWLCEPELCPVRTGDDGDGPQPQPR